MFWFNAIHSEKEYYVREIRVIDVTGSNITLSSTAEKKPHYIHCSSLFILEESQTNVCTSIVCDKGFTGPGNDDDHCNTFIECTKVREVCLLLLFKNVTCIHNLPMLTNH